MAGTIQVEHLFRHREAASAGGAQLHQRQRIDLQQADVLGQLVLALVQVVIGHLHGLDVEQQLFAGQQAFVAVQIVELDVGQRGIAQLVLQRALGLLGDLEGKLEGLGIKRFDFALHQGIEADGGLLDLESRRRCRCLAGNRRSAGRSPSASDGLSYSFLAMASRICAPRICLKIWLISALAELLWKIHSSSRRE